LAEGTGQKAELGFFHFVEIVTGWLVPSTAEEPACCKTGFFRHVRELKIQRKKSRQCFTGIKCWNSGLNAQGLRICNFT
jgi:hypothetical protein